MDPKLMRIRSARTLVFTREEGRLVAFNFLTKSTFSCSPDLLTFLESMEAWTGWEDLASVLPDMPAEERESTVANLLAVHALTAEGSPEETAEETFHADWRWGVPAALFHFSVQDREHMTLEEGEELQRAKLAVAGHPDLYFKNDTESAETIRLPQGLACNDLLQLMARRRTVRAAAAAPISLDQLSDCLFAGLGITGHIRNAVATLPLSMTPSGGARNPYEAFVYARQVTGLEPGFYHYAAIDHTLARLESDGMPRPSELVGGQEWADEMPCIIILCALLERTMWKYEDANAYRVVLIEAGHIGQNLMLAATRHGLSACPTAALNHSAINRHLAAKNSVTHAPMYALTLAYPGEAN